MSGGMPTCFWNIQLGDSIAPAELCNQIELECHPELTASCRQIEDFFNRHGHLIFSDPVTEMVQLIFFKMEDEVKHLLLKEKNLIFPGIKSSKRLFVLSPAAWQYIVQTQRVIAELIERIRHLLNHFQTNPSSSKEWQQCVQQFFQLEKKIHQWIFVEQNILYPSSLQTFSIN
jgi:iron-sulfur cluster repair protein YtfE (RIC family)